jgi:hypothetical protein
MTYRKNAAQAAKIDTKQRQHPLKQLREICGGISAATFAEITGISADSIRAAETQRRKGGELSSDQLNQILLSIGAYLDRETGNWLFLFTNENLEKHQGPVPYRKEHFDSFRAELAAEAHDRAGATCYLLLRLLYLLESVPAAGFNGWFWQIKNLLDKWGAKHLGFALSPNWDPREMRALGYRKVFWLEGEEQKFAQLIDAYRAERDRAEKPTEYAEQKPRPAKKKAL